MVWIQNLSKMWKLNFVHWVKVSCWLHSYFKSHQKKYFGRVVNFTHVSLLSQNCFFAITIYGFWISNEHILSNKNKVVKMLFSNSKQQTKQPQLCISHLISFKSNAMVSLNQFVARQWERIIERSSEETNTDLRRILPVP